MTLRNEAGSIPPFRAVFLIGRGVLIETIRRNDFYVLLLLCLLYMLGAGVVMLVGIERPATVSFLLNLGMTLAWFAAHLLTLLTIARQVPDELEARTLHPLLAKPVTRWHYLLGKWLFATVAGILTFGLLLLLSMMPWIFAPARPSLDPILFFQGVMLIPVSVAMMASLGLLGSLIMPKALNITLLVCFFLLAGQVKQFLRAAAHDTPAEGVIAWFSAYLPDFTRLNLFNRYTDGLEAIGWGVCLGVALHSLIFAGAFLLLSDTLFRRRPL